jgi:hypothetical protein
MSLHSYTLSLFQVNLKEENDNLPVDSNNEETDVREIQDTNDSVTKESDVLECSNNIQELHLKNNIALDQHGFFIVLAH